MSFYRTLLALVAAAAIAAPVFADDTADTTQTPSATQSTDSSAASPTASTDASASTQQDNKVNLNKATAKELMKVKGISASNARAIVNYRKKNGDFKSVDELANVKNFKKMKEDKLKGIEDQLSIE